MVLDNFLIWHEFGQVLRCKYDNVNLLCEMTEIPSLFNSLPQWDKLTRRENSNEGMKNKVINRFKLLEHLPVSSNFVLHVVDCSHSTGSSLPFFVVCKLCMKGKHFLSHTLVFRVTNKCYISGCVYHLNCHYWP